MNRYVVTSTQYIYADSDLEAIQKAEELALENTKDDNGYSVEHIHKIGFAEMVPTEIFS